jgi:uncharacterized protein YndB with AHSA1/START domain
MKTTTETTTQIYRIYIKATPERIWEAMTKPEFTRRYFAGVVELENGRCREHAPDGSLWHDGLIIESNPPRRLVHECARCIRPSSPRKSRAASLGRSSRRTPERSRSREM